MQIHTTKLESGQNCKIIGFIEFVCKYSQYPSYRQQLLKQTNNTVLGVLGLYFFLLSNHMLYAESSINDFDQSITLSIESIVYQIDFNQINVPSFSCDNISQRLAHVYGSFFLISNIWIINMHIQVDY